MAGGTRRYGLAVLSVCLASGIALYVQPEFGYVDYILFVAAALVSGCCGGVGPGLTATMTGGLLADYFLISPPYQIHISDFVSHPDLTAFLVTAALNTILIGTLRKAAHEALRAERRERMSAWASVAHDLKNPLGAIALRAQMLLRKAETSPSPPESLAEGLTQILAISRQTSQMLSELVDNARLDMGQALVLRPEEIDLVSLTRQSVTEVGNAGTSPITIKQEVSALAGRWDPLQLKRVLANILSNAVKYSPYGGEIVVTVSREEEKGCQYACVTVEDHGVGMSAEDLRHVSHSERFYRAESVRGRVAGAGLGLAGSREIIAAQGGTMRIESAEGLGTRVTVRLPMTVSAGNLSPITGEKRAVPMADDAKEPSWRR